MTVSKPSRRASAHADAGSPSYSRPPRACPPGRTGGAARLVLAMHSSLTWKSAQSTERGDLRKVGLQAGGQAAAVRLVEEPAVEAQLVGAA